MKRFRVYDKWLHETLEQSDTNDYSYRDKENMWICDITDALEDPTRFVVQENTEIKDIRYDYIFEGDKSVSQKTFLDWLFLVRELLFVLTPECGK